MNMPALVGTSMYGDGYYDPSQVVDDADRFDAQRAVSSSMKDINVRISGLKEGDELESRN